MALSKKRELRKAEFVFSDGEVHPIVHCLYHIIVEEDGEEISRSNHRENARLGEIKELINSAKEFVQPELEELT